MNEKIVLPKLIALNLRGDLWLWFRGNESARGVIPYESVFHFVFNR